METFIDAITVGNIVAMLVAFTVTILVFLYFSWKGHFKRLSLYQQQEQIQYFYDLGGFKAVSFLLSMFRYEIREVEATLTKVVTLVDDENDGSIINYQIKRGDYVFSSIYYEDFPFGLDLELVTLSPNKYMGRRAIFTVADFMGFTPDFVRAPTILAVEWLDLEEDN